MVGACTPQRAMAAAEKHMAGEFAWSPGRACTSACAAFCELWGVNPLPDVNFATELGALRILRRGGGVETYVRGCAQGAGLIGVRPVPGAIGLADLPHAPGWALGLCIEPDQWAVKGQTGIVFVRTATFAWMVPCPAR